ncbi:MAG TPA: cytochrome c biogenesis protein CcdA [Pyrinomonadaceae bacterium]|nr:cytochrome c biogenesis protein CcdA [Pyrinomonadaceae bacterium]
MYQDIRFKFFIVAIAVFLTFPALLLAQNPVSWTLESDAEGKTLESGEKIKVKLKANIEKNWYLYAVEQPEGGPYPTKISIAENSPFRIDGKSQSPAPVIKFDPNFNLETKYFAEQAEFNLPVSASAKVEADELAVNVKYQVCDDKICLPPKTVKVSFAGFEDARKSVVGSQSSVVSGETPATANSTEINESLTTNNRQPTTDNRQLPTNLWSFLWLAVTLGALSLLTPCVFPMIPITVSYFTNQSAGNRGKAVRMATVYSLGIIGTFTLVGMLLAIFVGAAGITLFAANPYVNLLIAAIFLFFAFNLFGAYEITIPTGVLTKLDNLTRSREGEGGGIVGALLMGLTFTLTSFTCTSPFVGTILVSASQGNWQMPLVGMLAFSSVFALPFFVLALLPQYVSSLPRAGGWMNSVKVAMGFLEIAAAMKFLSNVDLIWKWEIFTRNFVLSIWIAIGVILAIYLLGKFQLPHDSKPERIGAIRVVSAILSLAISFYLLTGLFGARLGELESFLPPEIESSRNFFNKPDADKLRWIDNDYEGALAKAKAENKLVFVDFTGYTCTNCRWMEANVFPKKAVEDEMKKFVLARLYTDGDGEVYEKQQLFQEQTFQTVALPFYAIMNSDGKTIATFPGLTRNVNEFVDFLKKAEEN